MAMVRNAVSFFAVAAVLVTMANAKNYTVGDANGWRLGVNYTAWAYGKTFRVGDKLEFKYDIGQHDVLQVSKQDYASCKTSSPIDSENSGHSILILNIVGKEYIICGAQGHCKQGMKLEINILESSAASILACKFIVLGTFALGLMMLASI